MWNGLVPDDREKAVDTANESSDHLLSDAASTSCTRLSGGRILWLVTEQFSIVFSSRCQTHG